MRGDGTLTVNRPLSSTRSIENEATFLLDEIALQLPRLEPARLPAVRLDSRILTSETGRPPSGSKAPRLAIRSALRVRTGKEALLYSNLAKTPIPLSLNVKFTQPQGALAGTIQASSFHAEVFRRNAIVDHMRLLRRPDSRSGEIDGLILYDAHEAQVRIRLLGTTEKPHVVLESDPPMNESEILGLLLYGKSPNELDPDQQSTVANTQTAIADRAFGLASLYLFASTPIEYVGFDPASRTYTMKFRIPGGASLELGSSLEASRTVQVRKRIASHFAIQAQGRNTPEGNSVGTFLEWFNRY